MGWMGVLMMVSNRGMTGRGRVAGCNEYHLAWMGGRAGADVVKTALLAVLRGGGGFG
jgi:hypothetical protein